MKSDFLWRLYGKINMEIVWYLDLPCFFMKTLDNLQTNFTLKSLKEVTLFTLSPMVLGQNPPGQNPPGQNPPGQNPPRTKSPRTKSPHYISPNCSIAQYFLL